MTGNKSFDKKRFAKDARKARRLAELTQEYIAKKVGMSRYSVILMEQGKHIPRIETLSKLSNLLGLEGKSYY